MKVNWFDRALAAARSVCRIVCADGNMGTGFLIEGGYLMTCNHVLPDKKAIEGARLDFLFDKKMDGSMGEPLVFRLDAEDFVSSPTDKLNYTRAKVLDPDGLPISLLREPTGEPLKVQVGLPGARKLVAQVWKAQVGRVPLLLLDSDVEDNAPAAALNYVFGRRLCD